MLYYAIMPESCNGYQLTENRFWERADDAWNTYCMVDVVTLMTQQAYNL
jgi:hypothetical protein